MAELRIGVGAMRWNLGRLRAGSAAESRIMLVAKSDFYGLGLDVASRLEPCIDSFAVGSVAEALELLALTEAKDIVVLYPPVDASGLRELVAACLEHRRIVPTVLPTPDHAAQLQSLLAAARHEPLACYVLVPQVGDRFWSDGSCVDVLADLVKMPRVDVRGAFTHFAEAHWLDNTEVGRRVDDFVRDVRRLWPAVPLSVADSHMSARRQGVELAFLRVGLFPMGMVGASAARAWDLRNALTLEATVVNSYRLPGPSRIGYCDRVVGDGECVAILDVGFASGLPFDFFRHCAAMAPDGTEHRFLETPWMEYSCILTGDRLLPVGTKVELFGDRCSAVEQADRAGLAVEAVFCHLSRVSRTVVSG